MENAQLIGLSRQIALQRQMDVIANNLANINTTGFKAEAMLFEEFAMPVARDRDFAGDDQKLSFAQDWATVHDFTAGGVTTTGNSLDVALQGDGFLVVDTPGGERYTRSGALQIDAAGQLVDISGNPVLGLDGPLLFQPDESEITILPDGTIRTSNGARGKLQVVGFEQPQALAREGSNYFSGTGAQPAVETIVVQGALETSNVSGVNAMAEMIRVNRAYQSLATVMQQQSELSRTAIQRLGELAA